MAESPLEFSKVIEEVEEAVGGPLLLGACYSWVDQEFDGAWDKMSLALEWALLTREEIKIHTATIVYRATALAWVEAFNRFKAERRTMSVIEQLEVSLKTNPS